MQWSFFNIFDLSLCTNISLPRVRHFCFYLSIVCFNFIVLAFNSLDKHYYHLGLYLCLFICSSALKNSFSIFLFLNLPLLCNLKFKYPSIASAQVSSFSILFTLCFKLLSRYERLYFPQFFPISLCICVSSLSVYYLHLSLCFLSSPLYLFPLCLCLSVFHSHICPWLCFISILSLSLSVWMCVCMFVFHLYLCSYLYWVILLKSELLVAAAGQDRDFLISSANLNFYFSTWQLK